LTVFFVLLNVFPLWTLLVFASLPPAFKLCRHVLAHHNQPERVNNSKFIAVSLHFWSGVLLCLGFSL
jgi:1,4-dihydroxy-2-naphthoate octaprenyltransferase